MSFAALSMFLNVLIVILLGVTIFYAIRLTSSLNSFRQARQDFNLIMRELSRNIEEAQRGLKNMKDSGQALQKIINDSRKMAQELQAINQVSTDLLDNSGLIEDVLNDPTAFEIAGEEEKEAGFSIYDPEYDKKPARKAEQNVEEFTGKSRAERDLYEALQKNRKSPGRGAF